MSFIYFYLLILVHPYLALWPLSFKKIGRSSWEALIPLYNYYVAFKVFNKKPFWSLLMFIPGIHLVMWAVVNTSFVRRFGFYSFVDTLQAIFFPYVLFYKIAKTELEFGGETNWANARETETRKWADHIVLFLCLPVIGHALALGLGAVTREKPGKKSKVKEWGDSILFALVAASIIRTYVFEPFQIPTGSMEKTLLVGDFLFVNKLAYGPKVPVTPLSYPLVHNTIPWVNVPSYTTFEKGTYTRLFGLGKIQRNDVVVFNYPSGDTAVFDPRMPDGLMGHDYHGIVINEALGIFHNDPETKRRYAIAEKYYTDSLRKVNGNMELASELAQNYIYKQYVDQIELYKNKARKMLAVDKIAHQNGQIISHFGVIYRPVDKRENYIKRCVGVPGDWLEIKKSILYINNQPAFVAEHQNLRYNVTGFNAPSSAVMTEKYGLERERNDYYLDGDVMKMNLTRGQLAALKKGYPEAKFSVDTIPQYADDKNYLPKPQDLIENLNMFPKDLYVNNTFTDFTKIQIPYKGKVVDFTKENIAWYRRIITAYEGHTLQERKDGIYIDGKKTKTYTIQMNYYWLMGDNRYNSADSRVWGFVPEDHVVGRASLVWFSKSPYLGVRWERIFKLIH